MATDTRSLPAFFNVDADFQSWCQGIAAQLVAAGMVKTSDTGQINNATVTKPGGVNTVQGYEVYKFSDSFQSGTPIFFKVEYGSGAAADRPSLWMTVGTGSNGSGTITGSTTTRTQFAVQSSKSAGVTLPSYCQGDGGGFVLCTNYDSTSNSFYLIIVLDRVTDSAGNATSDGVVLGVSTSGTHFVQGVIGNAVTTASTGFITTALGAGTLGGGSRSLGSNLGVMPMMLLAGQLRFLKRAIFYNNGDIAGEASTFTAINLGATHTFLSLGHANTLGFAVSNSSTDCAALLWE